MTEMLSFQQQRAADRDPHLLRAAGVRQLRGQPGAAAAHRQAEALQGTISTTISTISIISTYLNIYCHLQESINLCVAQVAVVHLAQVAAVLPLTLATRLLHNWVMGQMLCYTIPVITVNKIRA